MDYQDNQENTKELQDLKELREKAIDTLELELNSVVEDENLQEETFTKDNEEINDDELNIDQDEIKIEEPTSKEEPFFKTKKNLKEKWQSLSKKNKIMLIGSGILLIIIIISIILYFVLRPKEEEITPPTTPDVIVMEDNYRYENGVLIFLDKAKNELGKYTCKNQDQNLCFVAYYNNEDNFDEPKMVNEDNSKITKRSSIIIDQYVFIHDNKEENGLITLYDIKNEQEIENYMLVKAYDSLKNHVVLKNKMSQYGLFVLNENGIEPIIDFSYDYLGVIENNKSEINRVVTMKNNKWYLVDLQDKNLTKALNAEIKDYNDSYIKIKDENGYHLVDYNNAEINPGNYEYIDLLDEYVLFIENKKLWIRDYTNNPMNIDEITLENENYIEKATYDSNSKLIKREKSYEVSYQGKTMKIDITKGIETETTSINLNEGRVSASLQKLNYFNGKLYIYADEAKEELLGVYECSNKNPMNDDTTELQNCKIATESFYQDNDQEIDRTNDLGTLPIYNKKYAFIYDGDIVLYDLKENTSKAKYKSVDASAYTKNHDVNMVTTNSAYIMAENKSGKYGIIKISNEKVEGVIEFSLNHLECIGIDYIAQNESGYYLINYSGKSLTSPITNKIKNYNNNYVTTYSNNKYYLYDYSGKPVDDVGYDYIALYDSYYATVQNDELHLYSYKEPKEYDYLKDQEIPKLNNKNYVKNTPLAFEITINNNLATIKIDGKTIKSVSLTKVMPEDPKEEDKTEEKDEEKTEDDSGAE